MKHIKSIDIICENCEVFNIPAKYIGYIDIIGIERNIHRIAVNAIRDSLRAKEIAIEIFSEIGKDIIDRLINYNDITALELIYTDKSSEIIYVNYKDESDRLGAENLNQDSYISKLGNLYIKIIENKELEDYFDLEEINCTETVNFRKKMIGDLNHDF